MHSIQKFANGMVLFVTKPVGARDILQIFSLITNVGHQNYVKKFGNITINAGRIPMETLQCFSNAKITA